MDRLISSPKDVKVNIKNGRRILISEWPQVEHGNIYTHLILSRACDGKEMEKWKNTNRLIVMIILRVVPLGKFFNSPLMSALSNYDVIVGKSRVSYSIFTLRLSNIKWWILIHLKFCVYLAKLKKGNGKWCDQLVHVSMNIW